MSGLLFNQLSVDNLVKKWLLISLPKVVRKIYLLSGMLQGMELLSQMATCGQNCDITINKFKLEFI